MASRAPRRQPAHSSNPPAASGCAARSASRGEDAPMLPTASKRGRAESRAPGSHASEPCATKLVEASNDARTAEVDSTRWRLLLCGASPREVLARIVRDDPLRLRARIGARLLERCLLLDADRVLLRSFARIARGACRYQGRPDLGPWLDGHVDLALDDCRSLRVRAPSESQPVGGAFLELARPLRLDAARLAAACALFNELDDEARRVFFRLLLRRPMNSTERSRSPDATELQALRRALEPFLSVVAPPLVAGSTALAPASKREVRRAR